MCDWRWCVGDCEEDYVMCCVWFYVGDGVVYCCGSGEFDEESVGEGNVIYVCVFFVWCVCVWEFVLFDEVYGGVGVRRRVRVWVVWWCVIDFEDWWW